MKPSLDLWVASRTYRSISVLSAGDRGNVEVTSHCCGERRVVLWEVQTGRLDSVAQLRSSQWRSRLAIPFERVGSRWGGIHAGNTWQTRRLRGPCRARSGPALGGSAAQGAGDRGFDGHSPRLLEENPRQARCPGIACVDRRAERRLSPYPTPENISLLDIIEPTEGLRSPDRCILRGGPCDWSDACPIHDTWLIAQKAFADTLDLTDLAQLARIDQDIEDDGHPIASPVHRTPTIRRGTRT